MITRTRKFRSLAGRRVMGGLLCFVVLLAISSAGAAGQVPPAYFPIAALVALPQDAPPEAEPEPESRPVVLQMRSGTRVRGRLVEETDQAYRIISSELGDMVIPKDAVLSVLGPDAPLGPPIRDVEPPPPGLLGTQFLAGWEKSIALGFSGTSGNVDTLDVFSHLSGDYSNTRTRWRVRASYFYGLTESVNTKNEGFANARRDWLEQDSPWFFWAEGRLDYNDFSPYTLRTGGFGGIGYNFSTTERLRLLGRAGVGASYEFGDVDEWVPEALLSVEARWRVRENQTVEFVNTLFPDLDDFGEYRNFTEASYNIRLQRGRGLSLKLGLQNNYVSRTEDDSQHNSLTYFGALNFAF